MADTEDQKENSVKTTRKRGGNLTGAPKGNTYAALPKDIKESRQITRVEFERIVNKYFYCTLPELEKAKKDPKTTVLEMMVLSIIIKGIKEGDQKRMDYLLSRTIGVIVRPYEFDPIQAGLIPTAPPPPPPAPEQILLDTNRISDEALREVYAATAIIDVTPK